MIIPELTTPLYFGCRPGDASGHYLQTPDGRFFSRASHFHRLVRFDGLLAPCGVNEAQGQACLYHFGHFTAISFWDRSGDKRPGSNSTFFLPGILSFAEAISAAQQAFPWVFERIDFRIVCIDANTHDEQSIASLQTAYLHHAWSWDCEHCGTENFARAIVKDPDPEERADIEASPLGEAFPMIVMSHPETVACGNCGRKYRADSRQQSFGDGDEGEQEGSE